MYRQICNYIYIDLFVTKIEALSPYCYYKQLRSYQLTILIVFGYLLCQFSFLNNLSGLLPWFNCILCTLSWSSIFVQCIAVSISWFVLLRHCCNRTDVLKVIKTETISQVLYLVVYYELVQNSGLGPKVNLFIIAKVLWGQTRSTFNPSFERNFCRDANNIKKSM